ncbi:MAG TPA: hypothetical protein VNN20_02890 [Thermodesulfobacteriota bacterium]|nr:hypothetical protein [Thermodesulfobacteriota bacterium]
MNMYILASLLSVLLLNLQLAGAGSILGKVSVKSSSSGSNIYPLVSGNKMTYEYPSLIRIDGGTLVASGGTVFEAVDEGDKVTFKVDKGSIDFRLHPQKGRVSFRTPQGEINTPETVQTASTAREGRIVVRNGGTIVQVSKGVLETLDADGPSEVKAGENIFLGQKKELAQILPTTETCVELDELNKLVGENGIVDKKGSGPEVEVLVGGKVRDAVLVNDELEIIEAGKLAEDDAVEIVGVKDCKLLVHNFNDTSGVGRLVGAASALGLFGTAAILSAVGDSNGDGEVSPVQ